MQGAIHRLIRRQGIDVDHYWYDIGDRSTRGRDVQLADDAPETIAVIPDPGNRSLGFGAFGVEVEADMTYLASAEEQFHDGGGSGASRLVQHGDVFVVIDADRSYAPQGFQILECERDGTLDVEDLEAEADGGENT